MGGENQHAGVRVALEEIARGSLSVVGVGGGRVVAAGSFIGLAYWEEAYPGFEFFLSRLAEVAGAMPALRCSVTDGDILQWRFGESGGVPMLFVIGQPGLAAELALSPTLLGRADTAVDLATGERTRLVPGDDSSQLSFDGGPAGYRVFRFE